MLGLLSFYLRDIMGDRIDKKNSYKFEGVVWGVKGVILGLI